MPAEIKKRQKVDLWLDLGAHFTVTMVLAVYFYLQKGSVIWPVLCIIGGILIDLDHFIDYFVCYGPRFDLRHFLYGGYLRTGKFYVVFHSWELLILLWVLSRWQALIFPLVLSMTGHMLIDQFLITVKKPLSYSIIYRYLHRFDVRKTFPEEG